MDRFAPVLDRVSRGLALPEPERSRVVEEMTSDLEGLYEAYRERGMSEEEAVRRAEKALAASAETLAELSRIHAPLHRRLAEHYAEPGRHLIACRATNKDGDVQTDVRMRPFPEGSSGLQEISVLIA